MCVGVTTTYESKKEMNGKWLSRQTKDFLNVMFLGMCNSLATFQAMMDNIFMMMIDSKRKNTTFSKKPRNANSVKQGLNIWA
jgi:hypothetical protein